MCPVEPPEFSAVLKDHDAKPVQLFVMGNDQEKGIRRIIPLLKCDILPK